MNCPRCRKAVQDGMRYCTHCGYEFRNPDAVENMRLKKKAEKKQSNKSLYVLLGVVLLLLLVSTFFVFGGSDLINHLKEGRDDPIEAPVLTSAPVSSAAPVPTAAPMATAAPTPAPTPTPTTVTEPVAELDAAISTYLTAFVRDINSAEYWELYSAVQSGSAMEQIQKDFIAKSRDKNLTETLLDYQITARNKVNDAAYQITVIESYEVWQSEDPAHSLIKQRCTYLVNRQSDGTWKVADFAGAVEVLDRTDD